MTGADVALEKAAGFFAKAGDKAQEASARLGRIEIANSERRAEAAETLIQTFQPLIPQVEGDKLLQLRWLYAQGEHAFLTRRKETAGVMLIRCVEQADLRDPPQTRIAINARVWLVVIDAWSGNLAGAEAHLAAAEKIPLHPKGLTAAEKKWQLADARSTIDRAFDRHEAMLHWLPDAVSWCHKSFGTDSFYCWQLKRTRQAALLLQGAAEQALAHVPEFDRQLQRGTSPFMTFDTALLTARTFAINGLTERTLAPIATLESLVREGTPNALPPSTQIKALITLAEIRLRAGDFDQAERWLGRADAALPLTGAERPVATRRSNLAHGLILQARSSHQEAVKAMGIFCEPTQARVLEILLSLNCARSLAASGKRPHAIELVRNAVPKLAQSLGAEAPNTLRAKRLLDELEAPGSYTPPPWAGSQLFLYG